MDGETDGRGLVLLVHAGRVTSWGSWPGLLDADGYDTITVIVQQVGAAVRAMDRPPVLLGHGPGATAALGLRQQAGVAAVVAIAPVRTFSTARPRPGVLVVPPLLLVSGGRDVVARETYVERLERRARRRYPDAVSDHQVFPGRGHALVTDPGWEDVAGFVIDWLSRQNL